MAGCSGIKVKAAADCLWAEEIVFSEATKTWLETLDWPQSAYNDFSKITVHNRLFKTFCLEDEAR